MAVLFFFKSAIKLAFFRYYGLLQHFPECLLLTLSDRLSHGCDSRAYKDVFMASQMALGV